MTQPDVVEANKGHVYRVGNAFPITLMLPLYLKRVDIENERGVVGLFLQADVKEDGEVDVLFVNTKDYPVSTFRDPSEEQVDTLARTALQDLGVMHPGVADLLNFAEDFTARA